MSAGARFLTRARGYLGGWLSGEDRRRGIRVYRYHGVVPRRNDPILERNQLPLDDFVNHVEYLRRFRILGFEELMHELTSRRRSSPAVVMTFDDGFANNQLAAEVLARRRMPWMLFVPSAEVGEGRAMWLVELSLLLLRGDAAKVEALGRSWPLSSRAEREKAFDDIRFALKSLPASERKSVSESIRSQFPAEELRRLLAEFPSLRMLTWPEIAELARSGVEIGSHGSHHEMHHSNQPAGERRRELQESRAELEKRLGVPGRSFAYPNGDFVRQSPEEAEEAGYLAGFTTEPESVTETTSRFLIPRLSAPGSLRRLVRSHWWAPAERPVGSGGAKAPVLGGVRP